MSRYVRYEGYLKKVENPNNLSMEELAKSICEQRSFKLLGYYDTFLERLTENDEYIVLNGILYEIQELEELDFNDKYCDIRCSTDGRYHFDTQFYDGITYLAEILEKEFQEL